MKAAILAVVLLPSLIPADPPRVRVEHLPPMRPPCPVSALSSGDVFRDSPGGSLWMRCEAAAPDYVEPTHVLFGVREQPARGEWVYAVCLDRTPGLLVRMAPDTWAHPVVDVRVRVRE